MNGRWKKAVAFLLTATLLAGCCGALSASAQVYMDEWQMTEDGEFLYWHTEWQKQPCVQVVYIGEETAVTVPTTFDGETPAILWLTNEVFEFTGDPTVNTMEIHRRIGDVAMRPMVYSFEEGPKTVIIEPPQLPDYVRADTVLLPKSATKAILYTAGLTALSAPKGSALTDLSLYNVTKDIIAPNPTLILLQEATGLQSLYIGRDEYAGECFVAGSSLYLPTEFKRVPLMRGAVGSFRIAADPMPLSLHYADGSTDAPTPQSGDANADGSADMKDVLVMRQKIAGLTRKIWEPSADVDGDGGITMKDVLLLRKRIAGLN